MPLVLSEGVSQVSVKLDISNPAASTFLLFAQKDEEGNLIDTEAITVPISNDFTPQIITKTISEGCVSVFLQLRLSNISEYCYIDNVQLYAS